MKIQSFLLLKRLERKTIFYYYYFFFYEIICRPPSPYRLSSLSSSSPPPLSFSLLQLLSPFLLTPNAVTTHQTTAQFSSSSSVLRVRSLSFLALVAALLFPSPEQPRQHQIFHVQLVLWRYSLLRAIFLLPAVRLTPFIYTCYFGLRFEF